MKRERELDTEIWGKLGIELHENKKEEREDIKHSKEVEDLCPEVSVQYVTPIKPLLHYLGLNE